jgi:hypothetical protein
MVETRGADMTADDRCSGILASIGLAVGGGLGLAGTFAPSASLRGLAWGIDGLALVMASAVLTLRFYRKGQDIVAAGFLVFAVGEGVILSGAATELAASVPSFGAGTGMWAVALALISVPPAFPPLVRFLGLGTSIMFAATAGQIFMGVQILPTSSPLPFYAYPFFVATFCGWIWTISLKKVTTA